MTFAAKLNAAADALDLPEVRRPKHIADALGNKPGASESAIAGWLAGNEPDAFKRIGVLVALERLKKAAAWAQAIEDRNANDSGLPPAENERGSK